MRKTYWSIFFALTLLPAFAQQKETQEQLEKRKQQILTEIRSVQQLLRTEQTKERNILSEITEINRKVSLNRQLIENVRSQISITNSNISKNQKEVDQISKELNQLKQDYAETIVKAYQSRSNQSKMMFILSSENFFQAYKRVQYLKQYADFRKQQGEELKEKTILLNEALAKLEVEKEKQRKLLAEQQTNEKNLQADLIEQNNLVALVKKDQKKYNDQIHKKQAETKAIDKKIQQLIREAIAEANRKAREAKEAAARAAAAKGGTTTTTTTTKEKTPTVKTPKEAATFELTPEGKLVADNFKANKGKLPWPVEKGYVSLPYGDQPHPIQTQLTIHNSGIEITTEGSSKARAIFQGEVLQVQVLSGGNKAVLIQHGDYITVYQNLKDVTVKTGDKVSLKQTIGTINTNSMGKTVLKFLLSHNSNIDNPSIWLSRNN